MIYLLDIILGLNLLWAYKSFKNILCPPILVGAGMFLASIVATSYYDAWKMSEICFETVFYLGGSTVFFTLSCLLFRKKAQFSLINEQKFVPQIITYNLSKIKQFLIFLIVFGLLICFLKIREYQAYFGTFLNIQELLNAVRVDIWSGENEFQLPSYLRLASRVFVFFSYIICWFLSLHFLFYQKNKTIITLCIILLSVFVFDGFLQGAKGTAFNRIVYFATIFFFMYCCRKKSLLLSFYIIKRIILGFLLFIILFESINELIGRKSWDNIHDKSSLFAVYCGAQIKNFDIYIQGRDGNYDTKYWGGETLKVFYQETDEKYFRPPGTFQFVGYNSLGNVYTQVYAFHRDFGDIGVWIMTFIIACISMIIYNKTIYNLRDPYYPNIYLLTYSFLPLSLFMSFFSPRFTETAFTTGFVKMIIYIYVFQYIFNKLFRKEIALWKK